jgi:hypothetical protein
MTQAIARSIRITKALVLQGITIEPAEYAPVVVMPNDDVVDESKYSVCSFSESVKNIEPIYLNPFFGEGGASNTLAAIKSLEPTKESSQDFGEEVLQHFGGDEWWFGTFDNMGPLDTIKAKGKTADEALELLLCKKLGVEW